MKRSEMIDILDNALDTHTSVGSSCCNLGINKESLSKILKELENAGMLPPTILINTNSSVYYNLSGLSPVMQSNTWEIENKLDTLENPHDPILPYRGNN